MHMLSWNECDFIYLKVIRFDASNATSKFSRRHALWKLFWTIGPLDHKRNLNWKNFETNFYATFLDVGRSLVGLSETKSFYDNWHLIFFANKNNLKQRYLDHGRELCGQSYIGYGPSFTIIFRSSMATSTYDTSTNNQVNRALPFPRMRGFLILPR